MHPCPGKWVAISSAVRLPAHFVQEFNVGTVRYYRLGVDPRFSGANTLNTNLDLGLRFFGSLPASGSTWALFSTINVDQRIPFRSSSQANVVTVQIPFSHHIDQRW